MVYFSYSKGKEKNKMDYVWIIWMVKRNGERIIYEILSEYSDAERRCKELDEYCFEAGKFVYESWNVESFYGEE